MRLARNAAICNTLVFITAVLGSWISMDPAIHTIACRVDTIGWFGRTEYNITLYDTSTRRLTRECLALQRETSRRIQTYMSWILKTELQRRTSVRSARDMLVKAPCDIAANIAATAVETSAILKSVVMSTSHAARILENTTSILTWRAGFIAVCLAYLVLGSPIQYRSVPAVVASWTSFLRKKIQL